MTINYSDAGIAVGAFVKNIVASRSTFVQSSKHGDSNIRTLSRTWMPGYPVDWDVKFNGDKWNVAQLIGEAK